MKTETFSTTEIPMDIEHEISTFLLAVCLVMAALIAVWSFACLIGGLTINGPAGLMKGFIIAVTGG
ncbi:MAG TPA: hypothetical protein ENI89_03655 [Desulfobulbus sp.]|nr:hypothetical protein [Desulfobulbus sp.]